MVDQLKTGFSSVEEDLFFDGKSFGFQLFNPETESGDVEPEEFGLYFVGDTITLKWCTIDEANFDFWNTLEFSNCQPGSFFQLYPDSIQYHRGTGCLGWIQCQLLYPYSSLLISDDKAIIGIFHFRCRNTAPHKGGGDFWGQWIDR